VGRRPWPFPRPEARGCRAAWGGPNRGRSDHGHSPEVAPTTPARSAKPSARRPVAACWNTALGPPSQRRRSPCQRPRARADMDRGDDFAIETRRSHFDDGLLALVRERFAPDEVRRPRVRLDWLRNEDPDDAARHLAGWVARAIDRRAAELTRAPRTGHVGRRGSGLARAARDVGQRPRPFPRPAVPRLGRRRAGA
jgi:hypothetical protein